MLKIHKCNYNSGHKFVKKGQSLTVCLCRNFQKFCHFKKVQEVYFWNSSKPWPMSTTAAMAIYALCSHYYSLLAETTTYIGKKTLLFSLWHPILYFWLFLHVIHFSFGLRRGRRHSVCTLNATIGSSILSEIFGNHKLSYYWIELRLKVAAAHCLFWVPIFQWWNQKLPHFPLGNHK